MSAKITMRREKVAEAAKGIMEYLEASGLQPLEGLTAVESVYSLLLLRGMDAANGHAQTIDTAKHVALRSLNRMESRVLAWPARVEDRS